PWRPAFSFSKLLLPTKNGLVIPIRAGMLIPLPALLSPTVFVFAQIGCVDTLLPLIVPGLLGESARGFVLRQNVHDTPDSLVEAALLDGATYSQSFWRLTFPLIRPAIAAQFILWFMAVWNDYLGPIIYLNSENVQTLQLVIANFNATYAIQTDYPLIMAASL